MPPPDTTTSTTAQNPINLPSRYKDPIIKNLVTFISDSSFQHEFEAFFIQHCRLFDASTTSLSSSLGDSEHTLEQWGIYQKFQALFDSRIELFLAHSNLSRGDFLSRCEISKEADPTANHYVNIMLASTEYGHFVGLMGRMKKLHGDRQDEEEERAKGGWEMGRERKASVESENSYDSGGGMAEGKEDDESTGYRLDDKESK